MVVWFLGLVNSLDYFVIVQFDPDIGHPVNEPRIAWAGIF